MYWTIDNDNAMQFVYQVGGQLRSRRDGANYTEIRNNGNMRIIGKSLYVSVSSNQCISFPTLLLSSNILYTHLNVTN